MRRLLQEQRAVEGALLLRVVEEVVAAYRDVVEGVADFDVADLPFLGEGFHLAEDRHLAQLEADHEDARRRLCDCDHALCVRHGLAKGLFDQHVLAGLECGDGGLDMVGIIGGDQHGVDLRRRQHLAQVGVIRHGVAVLRSNVLEARGIEVADGAQLEAGMAVFVILAGKVDAAAAQAHHGGANRLCHIRPFTWRMKSS